jgi:pyruvate,water dikinase
MKAESALKNKIILAVDDEPDVLDSVEELLDMCTVHKAVDYNTAVQLLSSNSYDAVVLDIMGVNGFELLKIADLKGFPTVMLTGHAMTPEALKKSIELGAISFLPKEMMLELKDLLEDVVLGGGKRLWWLKSFDRLTTYAKDSLLVGNKSANLGEMIQIGLRVPPGFAIAAECYIRFTEKTGIQQGIIKYISRQDKIEGIEKLDEVSRTIRAMIEDKEIPDDLKSEIGSAYEALCKKMGMSNAPVAVRSSGLAEDSAGASFAGQFESFLNVKGEGDVLNKVKKVWSSAFRPGVISYRDRKGLKTEGDAVGVTVLGMVNARASGIGFTVDPVSGDSSKIIIEANWGLGEGVVSGTETVDGFVVDKENLEIITKHVGKKEKCVMNTETGTEWTEVPENMKNLASISDEEIKEIAKIAKSLEESLGCPQDMEWAIDQDLPFPQNIFYLQTRPAKVAVKKSESATDQLAQKLVTGFKQIDLSKAKDKLKNIEFRF